MRIRLKINRRFSLERLLLYIAVICVSSFALLEHVTIAIPLFSVVKLPLLYVAGICILSQTNLLLRTFMKKKNFYIWLLLFGLCLALVLSAYSNRNTNIGTFPMLATFRAIFFMVDLLALMIWVSEKGYGSQVINFLFYYVLLLVIVTDVLLFTDIVKFSDGRHKVYLVGTKFTVSYMHMNLLTLWVMKTGRSVHIRQLPKIGLFLAAIFLVAISLRVECITGLIGCVLLFLCLFGMNPRGKSNLIDRMASPVLLLLALAAGMVFPFVSKLVISIPAVNYVIVEILGRSESLTGRTNIFEIFGTKMAERWAFGFGFGNGNAAAMELFGYANAQNAMHQWILQGGVVSAVMLALFMMAIFGQLRKSGNRKKAMPLVVLIYVYIILGFAETTFSMSFLMWVAMIYMIVNEKTAEERLPIPDRS